MKKETISSGTFALKNKADNLAKRINANKIMVRTFVSSILFFAALVLFSSLVRDRDIIIRWSVILYGVGIIAFFLYNILNYLTLISRTAISKAPNFPLILFLNTFLGFISQLFFFNLALSIIVRLTAQMPGLGCEVRCLITQYYDRAQIYNQISNMIWWLALVTIIAFFVGNYLVWVKDSKSSK